MIPYKLSFNNISEVRMGSPFNKANVTLVGSYVPSLAGKEFQDVGLVCKNGIKCAIVQWDLVENEPRFKIWILDQETEKASISEPIVGACISLMESNDDLIVKVWSYDMVAKKGIVKDIVLKIQ